MQRYAVAILGVLLFEVVAGGAYAQNAIYQFSTQRTCWEDTEGFAPGTLALLPLPPPGTQGIHFIRRTHIAGFGTAEFNPDGTGLTQLATSHLLTNSGPAYVESQSTCPFTHVLNPDAGSLDITFGTCTFQNTVGSQDFGTVTGAHVIGQLAQGGEVIVESSSRPLEIETVNVRDGER